MNIIVNDGQVIFAKYYIIFNFSLLDDNELISIPFQKESDKVICYTDQEKDVLIGILQDLNISFSINEIEWSNEKINKASLKRYSSRSEALNDLFPAYSIEELKEVRKKEISEKCRLAILSNFQSSCLGIAHTYGFDEDDQTNFSGFMTAIANGLYTSSTVEWNTKDSGYLTHTIDEMKQLYMDGFIHKQTKLYRCGQLKTLVDNCSTIEEVNAIQITY
jgi:hypothetical protein